MIRLNQIKTKILEIDNNLTIEDLINNKVLYNKISKIIKTKDFIIKKIVKKSIDARDKNNLMYIFTVDIESKLEKEIIKQNINNNNIMLTKDENYILKSYDIENKNFLSPIIIGSGPAGYFAGLYLARMGFKPIIFERGKNVYDRVKDVENFWNNGTLNINSNVAFGEGGAGTFSDGKLNTGIKDKTGRIHAVINDFIKFGAPEDIGYLAKPHIGTNELRKVMYNLRQEIISLGGKVYFNSCFTGYSYLNNNTLKIKIKSNNDGNTYYYNTNSLILAIGHSARDTFQYLSETNIKMEPKPFAIGLRIEHLANMINKAQYGESEEAELLPTADYKMTYHANNGRGVYSFCMCPGGFVVNASSEIEQCVVNGMSNHARDELNSNSAIVCNVTPEDFVNEGFGEYGVLSGMYFQKKFEKLAFIEGKGNIPIQLFKDYKNNKISSELGNIKPNIKGRYSFGNLNNCLPVYVNNAIIEAVDFFDKKLKGFASDDAILSGIESRTSSPIRIIRDDKCMSNLIGIFPCGEGAGYAGGITSAAVDGIKVSEAVAEYISSL